LNLAEDMIAKGCSGFGKRSRAKSTRRLADSARSDCIPAARGAHTVFFSSSVYGAIIPHVRFVGSLVGTAIAGFFERSAARHSLSFAAGRARRRTFERTARSIKTTQWTDAITRL
jgi:hypothetical protein